MKPTAELDGTTLTLTRRFNAPIDDVWAAITESDRVGRWYGTWTGDPADGFVMLTMNGEGYEVPPARFDIGACEPPNLLAVHSVDPSGAWRLRAELSETESRGEGPRTTLVFSQERLDLKMLGDVGPGWEWYLDRLVATVDERPLPTLEEFEADYMSHASYYTGLAKES